MAKHKDFTVATDVQVYFCDPQSPWQRGTNENTNLLLRQYFPRGTDLPGYSQAQLDQVALRLNQRSRKTLGFQTPASRLQASIASTIWAGSVNQACGLLPSTRRPAVAQRTTCDDFADWSGQILILGWGQNVSGPTTIVALQNP
jgi:hypothetical protein